MHAPKYRHGLLKARLERGRRLSFEALEFRRVLTGLVELVADVRPGPDSNLYREMLPITNTLYFGANDHTHGYELWKTDGTTTELVEDLKPGSSSSEPNQLTNFNGKLYFVADAGVVGKSLWRTDGITTELVKDFHPEVANPAVLNLRKVGDSLYFTANDGTSGLELWKHDGTNTVLIQDIQPGSEGSAPAGFTEMNGKVYFAQTGTGHNETLWVTDGITANQVADIGQNTGNLIYADTLTNLNGTLVFRANDGVSGSELWKFDGTTASRVADIKPGFWGSGPAFFTNHQGILYFRADDGTHGYEIWRYDGTTLEMVGDWRTGKFGFGPEDIEMVNDDLYFSPANGFNEIWKTNNHRESVVVAKLGGGDTINDMDLQNVNGTVYFGQNSNNTGAELWRTNGESTVWIADLAPGSQGSHPHHLTNFNGQLYFVAFAPDHGQSLWRVVEVPDNLAATLDAAGNLNITDTQGVKNELTISRTGTNLLISDKNERFPSAPTGATLIDFGKTLSVPLALIQGKVNISTGQGDDKLEIKHTSRTTGNAILPSKLFTFDFGTETDELQITGPTYQTWKLTGSQVSSLEIEQGLFGTFNFSGLENATGGTGVDNFQLLNPSAANGFLTLDGGAGGLDKITASRNTVTNFTLTNTKLTIDSSGVNLDQTLALANMERAYLTGSIGNDTFDVSGWTSGNAISISDDYGGKLSGNGGIDVVIKKANAASFEGSDALLATSDGLKMHLVGGIRVILEDLDATSPASFDLTNYSRTGTIKGTTSNPLTAAANKLVLGTAPTNSLQVNFVTIKNQQFAKQGAAGIVTMIGINSTEILGAANANTVKYRNFAMTGTHTFNGGGGNDTIDFDLSLTPNLADSLTLTDSLVTVKKGANNVGSRNLTNVENVNFIGTDPTQSANTNPNVVDLSAWSGTGNVILGNGATDKNDSLIINHGTRTASQTIAVDAANLTLTDGANAAKVIQFKGLDAINLTTGTANDYVHGTLYTGKLNATTGDGNDVLVGGKGNNTLDGGAGNDWISGNEGNDTITGGSGKNVLFGGQNVDSLTGGNTDADLISGGASNFDKINSSNPTHSKAIMDAILAAWSGAANVAAAVQTLNVTGLNLNGQTIKLEADRPGAPTTPNTVLDDNVVDSIAAGNTQDWLFLEDNNVGDETPATATTGADIVSDLA